MTTKLFCYLLPVLRAGMLAFILPATILAQGTLVGHVSNAATGALLEGAEVTVAGTALRTVTDRKGSFVLPRVPAGKSSLHVYYTGLEAHDEPVEISTNQTASVKIALHQNIVELQAFTVSASREGEAASITKQRNAENVMNVVGMEAFGRVADGNIGNFLVRLPGIVGDMENGEVTGISIRGMPPALNSVNIDGVRGADALAGFNSMGDRAAQIDHIPAEFIKEIEVNKAPLPENPVDSLGAGVNLVTKSALDFDRTVLTYRAGVNHNMLRSDLPQYTPNAALSYLTRLGARRNIGVAFSFSYSDSVSPRNRVDMQRAEADGRNTQARMIANANERTRIGAGLKFDYRFDEQTSVYLKLQHNYFKTVRPRTAEYNASVTGSRRVADYNVVSRAAILAGAVPRDSANQPAGVAPGYTSTFTELLNAGWLHSVTDNWVNANQETAELGFTRTFSGNQKIIFTGTYNPSRSKSLETSFNTRLTTGIGMAIDTSSDPRKPDYRQTYGPNVGFGANYDLYTGSFAWLPEIMHDDIKNGKLDYIKDFALDFPLQFKSGINWREQLRRSGSRGITQTWDLVGPDGVAGTNPATRSNDDNIGQFVRDRPEVLLEVQGHNPWPAMPSLNYRLVARAFQEHPNWWRPTAAGGSDFSEITEDVSGSFVQGRTKLGRLTVIGGARVERTEVEAVGRYTDPRRPTTTRVTKTRDYTDIFPSVHFKYQLQPGLLARASYSTGMARPNMSDLYPVTTVSYAGDGGTVTQNDPGLKPQYAKNTDLSLEYYFEPAGVLSVGWFHKDISDFISRGNTAISTGSDNGFDGNFGGFTLVTTRNIGQAEVNGFEINYSQNLVMLPKPFNGLSVYANYTKLKTSGKYSNGVSELDGFVPKSANAGVTYRWRKLQVSGTMNYTGDFLRTYNANIFANLRFRPKTTYDASLQYSFRPQLALFFDIINITDSWPVWYTGGDPSRVRITDSYGARWNLGVTGRF